MGPAVLSKLGHRLAAHGAVAHWPWGKTWDWPGLSENQEDAVDPDVESGLLQNVPYPPRECTSRATGTAGGLANADPDGEAVVASAGCGLVGSLSNTRVRASRLSFGSTMLYLSYCVVGLNWLFGSPFSAMVKRSVSPHETLLRLLLPPADVV